MPAASPARPPRRFRRRLLLVLLVAGAGPLVAWGLATRSLIDAALSVAPPVEPLVERAADALDRGARDPALVDELRGAELHLAQAELARRQLSAQAPRYFVVALALSVALMAAAAWLLGRRLSRPVEALADGMAHFARGDLDHEVRGAGDGDELAFLASELNRMGRQLQAQRARLEVSEKLAAWSDVARAMGHDLKNPLTAMRMAMGRLTRPGRSDEALADAVSLLHHELEMLIRMTQSFSDFARLPDPIARPLDLGALLEEVAGLYREQAPAGLTVHLGARPTVSGDADQLRRAFGNLVKNALEATRDDGPVEIVLEDAAPLVRVLVRDAGVGIAAPIEGGALVAGLASSKTAGRSGLGLPITQKIVHDHGGRLRLQPRAPRGTDAIVELPAQVLA